MGPVMWGKVCMKMFSSTKRYLSITTLHLLLTALDLISSFTSSEVRIWMCNSNGNSSIIVTARFQFFRKLATQKS